jgi:AAA15 family ATPase/GTPase
VRKLLDLFHNPAINTKKSQLFFTTHMVNLLDQKLLRRDQIWFVEKNKESTPETEQGASELHRLTEFSPRKTDNIERNYLAGEYGAIPKAGDISRLIACF